MKLSRDAWLVVFLTICIVLVSAFPFRPLRSPAEMSAMVADFFVYAIDPPIYRTVLERVIPLVPLGFFAARAMRGQSLPRQIGVLLAGSVLLCLGFELVQLPVEGRHARSSDALLALVCVISGYALAVRLYDRDTRKAAVLTATTAIFPSFLALTVWAVGPSTINWAMNYPVLIGDELDGNRPWDGEISGIAIYPTGLTAAQAKELSDVPFDNANARAREDMGALWVYAGEDAQGAPVHPLEFPGPKRPPGAALPEDLGRSLAQRTRASDRFAVEVRLRAAKTHQYGPARIVTNSISAYLRNFTLAQARDWYVFRMRTLSSGANGDGFALSTHDNAVTGAWQHVIASYDGHEAVIYVDGQKAVGPYAYDRFTRWDGLVFAPTLVLMIAAIVAGALTASLIWPRWVRRRR